jgi:hypothetical protein
MTGYMVRETRHGPIPGGGVALGEKVQIVLELQADTAP